MQPSSQIERTVGYGLIVFLSALVLLGLNGLRHEAGKINRRIQVAFPSLATLMEDDPVLCKGVPVGKVSTVTLSGDTAIATLELFDHRFLNEDARFMNVNHSLMGARHVLLIPGHSSQPLAENTLQTGIFLSGVSETIHRVGELLTEVIRITDLAANLAASGNTSGSLQNVIQENLNPLTQKLNQWESEFPAFEKKWQGQEKTWERGLDSLNRAMVDLKKSTHKLEMGMQNPIKQADSSFMALEESLAGIEHLLIVLENPALKPLIDEARLYDLILKSTNVFAKAMQVLQQEGLSKAIEYKRNVHLRKRKNTSPN